MKREIHLNRLSSMLIFLILMITSCTLKEAPPVQFPPVVQPPPRPAKIALVLGADSVIAVDISKGVEQTLPGNTMETILQSFNTIHSRLASLQLSKADVVIRPKVGDISSRDFSKRHETILEGEKAALEALPHIIKIVTQLRLEGRPK